MKHYLMARAFADAAGERALEIDNKARVWTVTRGADGKLEGDVDLSLLLKLNPGHSAEQLADALMLAAALADIDETRAW